MLPAFLLLFVIVRSLALEPLPDSLFAPPAGYQKFDMGNMMKGMMPGR